MEPQSTSRINVKKVYWQQQIRNWKVSGLSQKMFCRQQSLALSTFTYWTRRLRIPETETVKFYPLSIPAPHPRTADSGLRLLVGKERFTIEIKVDFSPTALKNLISTLEQL